MTHIPRRETDVYFHYFKSTCTTYLSDISATLNSKPMISNKYHFATWQTITVQKLCKCFEQLQSIILELSSLKSKIYIECCGWIKYIVCNLKTTTQKNKKTHLSSARIRQPPKETQQINKNVNYSWTCSLEITVLLLHHNVITSIFDIEKHLITIKNFFQLFLLFALMII